MQGTHFVRSWPLPKLYEEKKGNTNEKSEIFERKRLKKQFDDENEWTFTVVATILMINDQIFLH